MNCFVILSLAITLIKISKGQSSVNPSSDISDEENHYKATIFNNDHQEIDEEDEERDAKDKMFLDEALKAVLDPKKPILLGNEYYMRLNEKVDHLVKRFKSDNKTLDLFLTEMDSINEEMCRIAQNTLWSYIIDPISEDKRNKMLQGTNDEDETKELYWMAYMKHFSQERNITDTQKRMLRIVRKNVLNLLSRRFKTSLTNQAEMIWIRLSICEYNKIDCQRRISLNEIKYIFKKSTNSDELLYYWQTIRDETGRTLRPIIYEHIVPLNKLAQAENFTDIGEMWRFSFDDDDIEKVVEKLWHEVKPVYDVLHTYVKIKLKKIYKELNFDDNNIPAHILGTIWAENWQPIFDKLQINPSASFLQTNFVESVYNPFKSAEQFHSSLGYKVVRDIEFSIQSSPYCVSSSYDMCDQESYKILWCEHIMPIAYRHLKAGRLLSHVLYFNQYKNLKCTFRDGPSPYFHDGIADLMAQQMYMVENDNEKLNYLLWLALEKLPSSGFYYVLDKWRWDIFRNDSLEFNQHWWDLRTRETGLKPPLKRSEMDLDPASWMHATSQVHFVSKFLSNVLTYQILKKICFLSQHVGPLHNCSLHDIKQAGCTLSKGMSLGASEDWRTVLEQITGERELSSQGFIEFFKPLTDELQVIINNELKKDYNKMIATSIVGAVGALLVAVLIVFCIVKRVMDGSFPMISSINFSRKGSLDISNEMRTTRETNKETEVVKEEKL